MIKALVLSRHFPPSGEVGGFRAEGWSKYLPEFGIAPLILTPSEWNQSGYQLETHSEARISYFDYNGFDEGLEKGMSRPKRLMQRFMAYGTSLLKKNNFYTEACQLLEAEKFDVILVTAPPYFLLKIGALLSKKYGIPWVADSRDAWTTNKASKAGNGIKNKIFRVLEKRVMRNASLITTVSPTNLEGISSINGSDRVFCVENGFFEEDFESFASYDFQSDASFKVAYLGALYPYMPVELFVEGVKRYQASAGQEVAFNFIGIENQKGALARVTQLIEGEEGLKLFTSPKIIRQQAIEKAIQCDALLLLADPKINLLPTKIYDYMAMQRPIIVVRNDHSYIYELLRNYDQVYFADSPEEVEQAMQAIAQNQDQFKFSRAILKSNTYTRRNLSNQFARLTLERI